MPSKNSESVSSSWENPVFTFFLRWLEKPSPGPAKRVCFSGEQDSNQSSFEEQSNNLEIGVIANNDDEGRLMLAILRVIIDDSPNLAEWPTDIGGDKAEKVKAEVKDSVLYSYLFDIYGDREDGYFTSFGISDKKFTADLGDETITKNYSQVDLWNRKRLYNELKRLLKKHKK